MNETISALLELQAIEQQRRALRRDREEKLKRLAAAQKASNEGEAAAKAALAESERYAALVRQYQSDVERCETSIGELRAKQPEAKTNREYMEIMNGIEAAKLEKVKRESSIKDITGRIDAIKEKAAQAAEAASGLQAKLAEAEAQAAGSHEPGPEEAALTAQYDEKRKQADPKFLEHFERLLKANHKTPLLKVDPGTRATPLGTIISHNQVEQVRTGKLVIDRASNAILYLA